MPRQRLHVLRIRSHQGRHCRRRPQPISATGLAWPDLATILPTTTTPHYPFVCVLLTQVNGERVSRVGEILVPLGSELVSIVPKNSKSFGRVTIDSAPIITLQVDVVLPKKEWKIAQADHGMYSHINLKFLAIQLTPSASGILGATQADNFTFQNASRSDRLIKCTLDD